MGLGMKDIAIPTEVVRVGEVDVRVRGVSIRDVFSLLERFPLLQNAVFVGRIALSDMVQVFPIATGPIIAAAFGGLGDAEAEEIASNLPLETQIDFLESIGRLTFRNGFGPFVERINRIADAAEPQITPSPGKDPATISPSTSTPSSVPDTTTTSSGA